MAMESWITTPPYFSNSGIRGRGYLEDVLQLHCIPNSSHANTTNLLLYHPPTPPLQLDSTCLLNTHITSNALSTSTSETSSIRSRRSSVDQESMIFPTPIQSNYYSPPLEQDTFSSSLLKDIHIMSSPNYTCGDHDQLQKSSLFSITCQENNNELERMKQKMRSTTKRRKRRLVYHPFALVKPGGEEGDITLNDINTRMLMPPTRPIPHPVGHFASRPSSHRPTGKPILALTTIRTLGTGTLTIITT